MAEYLYPGVYVEEQEFSTPPVTGGSASIGAFVGFAPRGEVGVPTLVTSWTDFVNKFALGADSPYLANAYLAYSVYGFFNNGGQMAYIVRATDGTEAKATISLTNGLTPIVFTAKDAGTWGNDLKVKITANTGNPVTHNVEVYKGSALLETHRNLSLTGVENSLEGVINEVSKYVTVETEATTMDASSVDALSALSGGTDGLTSVTTTQLADAMRKFDTVDTINLLVMPESQAQAMATDAVAYAEGRKDCTFIADSAQNDDFETVQTFKELFNEDSMALYFPWVQVADPIGRVSKTKYVPNAGHVAGTIARTDTERGVFKAPAGVEATLRGVIGVKTKINDTEQGVLNPKGINVIRSFPDAGIVIWGARTTSGKYLNVVRELKYVMASIFQSTKWAVFEPNNEDLWRKIRNQLVSFLEGRRLQGAYKGTGEGSSYFVKCDSELNTPAEVDAGRVNTDVGIATNKPGEFIIFRVGQWEGGGSVE